ncbi:MAG: purine-nucleoside phosphorylase [Planctomycetes bacterium]|nr:purine-nucleoside phosphorylase [Planctomycetota bacterium]
MPSILDKLDAAVEFLRPRVLTQAKVGIVLGTGLGRLAEDVQVSARVNFDDIPHVAATGVASHKGEFLAGKLNGTNVFVLDGRLHGYEGHAMENIVFPVRLLARLGVKTVVLSNAAGGLNTRWKVGDIMVLNDHINLPGMAGINPLVGPNEDKLGVRFPDMSEPYDRKLVKLAHEIAKAQKLKLREGVYVQVFGPNLETRAEYRFLRNMGADVVGMSTVPEVVAARHMGLKVVAFSILTDMCDPDHLEEANIEKIIATANEAEPKLAKLVKALVGKW